MAKRKATTEETTAVVAEEVKVITVPAIPKLASLFLVGDQEINKELLHKRIEETKDLVIDGVKDTAGYKAVNTALAEFRTTRTTLEKVRKSNVEPIQDFLKEYKSKTDELKEICSGQEAILAEKLKTVDDEKERIKKEKELEKLRIMQARVQGLLSVGAVSDPENGTYSFPFALQFFTNDVQLSEMDDEEYNELLADVTECYNAEVARIAQEKADKEAEDERIRLQGIAQAEEATRLNAKRTALRLKELKLHGFSQDDEFTARYVHPLLSDFISVISVEEMNDEEWDQAMLTLESDIEEAGKPKPEVVAHEGYPMNIGDSFPEAVVDITNGHTTIGFTTDGKALTATDADLMVQDTITEVDELAWKHTLSLPDGYEDLQVASKFFIRIYPISDKESILSGIHADRLISSGQFVGNYELGWTLIKLLP